MPSTCSKGDEVPLLSNPSDRPLVNYRHAPDWCQPKSRMTQTREQSDGKNAQLRERPAMASERAGLFNPTSQLRFSMISISSSVR